MKKIIIPFIVLVLLGILSGFSFDKDLIFSHKFHLEEAGASCSDCHGLVNKSNLPTDNLLPAMATCYNCHDEDDTDCGVCHINPDEAKEVERIVNYKAVFPHATHAKSDEDCSTCHKGIEEKNVSGPPEHIPANQVCSECHESADFAENKSECLVCHKDNFGFKPADHNVVWVKNHGVTAEINPLSCNHCHQTNYCVTCHEGDDLDHKVHSLNFRNNHGIRAKANKENCITCHQDQNFCMECHQNELVMPKSHNFANWANTSNGGRHVHAARYDYDTCLSCHNDSYSEVVCSRCHH